MRLQQIQLGLIVSTDLTTEGIRVFVCLPEIWECAVRAKKYSASIYFNQRENLFQWKVEFHLHSPTEIFMWNVYYFVEIPVSHRYLIYFL